MRSETTSVYRCFFEVLSPIHVGCDEVYEPMGFVMDEREGQLVAFDPAEFIAAMPEGDKHRLSEICSKGTVASILEVYKFFRGKKADGKSVPVCNGLLDHYQKTLGIPPGDEGKINKELNNFTISRTSFIPSEFGERPYIPGSAVKGALRTAYLNSLAPGNGGKRFGGKFAGKNMEETFLKGKFATDPFRLVKVSDFMPVGEVKSRIVYAVNEKKKPSKFEARGPYRILEIIEPGSVFQGRITVDIPHQRAGISEPVSLDALLNSADAFYSRENQRETGELGNIGIGGVSFANGKQLFPIRVGRHSGAESVTVEGFRDIRIMGKGRNDTKYEDRAGTFWLASEVDRPKRKNGLRPFGWAAMGKLTPEMEREFRGAEEDLRFEMERRRNQILLERERAEAEKLKAAQLARQKEIEEKERKEEAERLEKALAGMSPDERAVAELGNPEISESRVVEIFNGLGDFSGEARREVAVALKEFWESRGKWTKKQCSKKQWIKVQKVQEIIQNITA